MKTGLLPKTPCVTEEWRAATKEFVEVGPLLDTAHDNYLLIDIGWRSVQRIHHITVHLRIRIEKIWIEADNTRRRLVQASVAASVVR